MTKYNKLQKKNFKFNCRPLLLQLTVYRGLFIGFNVADVSLMCVRPRFYSTSLPSGLPNNFNLIEDLCPAVRYSDADSEKVQILADNRKKVGVYIWVNNVNGNKYVGSSVSLSVRMYTYYSLRSLAKSNRPIDRALLKYGFSKFSLYILEYCTSENVIEREQYYLDLIKPEYNIVEKAGSTIGYKHTEDSLAKMRNFVLSDEVRKRKASSTANASAANRVPILVENIKTNEVSEYISMTEASKVLGVHKNAVGQAISNNRLIKKTYRVTKKTSD